MNDLVQEFVQNQKDRGSDKEKEFNPATDAVLLAPFIEEAVVAKEKISLFQGSLKDIKDRAKKDLGIKPKQFNQILNMRFKRNRDEVEEENEELVEIYDAAFPEKSNQSN